MKTKTGYCIVLLECPFPFWLIRSQKIIFPEMSLFFFFAKPLLVIVSLLFIDVKRWTLNADTKCRKQASDNKCNTMLFPISSVEKRTSEYEWLLITTHAWKQKPLLLHFKQCKLKQLVHISKHTSLTKIPPAGDIWGQTKKKHKKSWLDSMKKWISCTF